MSIQNGPTPQPSCKRDVRDALLPGSFPSSVGSCYSLKQRSSLDDQDVFAAALFLHEVQWLDGSRKPFLPDCRKTTLLGNPGP